ncbi:DUF3095 domain-containing protein [Tychonema sp. LEGE 07199]|uniref:DUF3095 domain-containing protein n=1 Tax=unclassified Tychonema TaxID=2642144 RepID=UPI001881F630|nr:MULTISPECIES: DUF3095 domain-containing protein [unclassified Tychonema]MBE9120794.1 DUF3095 domain-containing protein [Tychonema sp. LEGE 07199]MBE9134339.1 DUF3095 domain-containing protein [Tychonema sp. LEGE 07196]
MNSENFYSALPLLDNFLKITDLGNFVDVPDDWYIVVTDIRGSTKAIEAGKYKEVNLLGACSIAAVLNVAGKIEIPFIFGGDGASLLMGPSLLPAAKIALLATQQMAKTEFDMDLRVGAVPVKVVVAANYPVKIAKFKVSENYSQAVFIGGGLTRATELIKDPAAGNIYSIKNPGVSEKADFSGLECRWQDIPSKYGEIVTLLVMVREDFGQQSHQFYRKVIKKIEYIYGKENSFNPIDRENLKLTLNSAKLIKETQVRASSDSWLDRQMYLSKIQLETAVGSLLMNLKVKTEELDWGVYKDIAIAATDYRKFDDMLRMVISGNEWRRKKLTRYLERNYREGKLVYGLHVADRALMTCLVFERNGHQVHFIDGADGGYTLAAKDMKQRMQN